MKPVNCVAIRADNNGPGVRIFHLSRIASFSAYDRRHYGSCLGGGDVGTLQERKTLRQGSILEFAWRRGTRTAATTLIAERYLFVKNKKARPRAYLICVGKVQNMPSDDPEIDKLHL